MLKMRVNMDQEPLSFTGPDEDFNLWTMGVTTAPRNMELVMKMIQDEFSTRKSNKSITNFVAALVSDTPRTIQYCKTTKSVGQNCMRGI